MKELLDILHQINELSGVAMKALEKATGGGHEEGGKPEEGSPQEERQEPPQEAKAEGDQPRRFPPGQ